MSDYYSIQQRLRQEFAEAKGVDMTNPEAVSTFWDNVSYSDRYDIESEALMEWEDTQSETISQYDSVANVFTKADRIITNQDITVNISPANSTMKVVASNNGSVIAMNPNLLDNVDEVGIVGINGVNYHELAHALYSPRAGSELGKWVTSETVTISDPSTNAPITFPKYQFALNTLEEARIETLMVTKYPSSRYFLEVATTTYAIDTRDRESLAGAFYLTRGRRHLDPALRQQVADLYVATYGLSQAQHVARIIDEYRTLAFPKDSARAKELIIELYQYVGHQPPSHAGKNGKGQGCGERKLMRAGRPAKGSEQSELQNKARQAEGQAEKLREPDNKSDKPNEESRNAGTEVADDTYVDNQNTYEGLDTIAQEINNQAKQIALLPDVLAEVKTLTKALNGEGYGNNLKKDNAFTYDTDIPQDVRYSATKFGDELERLRVDNDPMWEKERPSGKLNVPRTMNASINDLPRLFDKWSEGNDNCDIEAVIMLDRSGSMSHDILSASRSVWAMKRGLERINANVAVISFNQVSRNLYDIDEKAQPNSLKVSRTGGGTEPSKGLRTTYRLMRASSKATKLVFIVTDGSWSNENECNAVVKSMQEDGVVVCVVYIGNLHKYEYIDDPQTRREAIDRDIKTYGHGADHFTAITKPNDLVQVARKVVTSQLAPARR